MFRFLSKYGQLRRNSSILTQRLAGAAPARKHFLRGVKKGFAKGEAFRILKTDQTRSIFNERRTELKIRLKKADRGYLRSNEEIHVWSCRLQ